MSSRDYTAVAGHPGLLLDVYAYEDGCVRLTYIGDADVLIAAGLATAELLAPQKKWPRGPRRRRTGPEWDSVERYWAVRNGVPVRRCRLSLFRERQNALRLPGAREAIDEYEAYKAAQEREAAQDKRARQDLADGLLAATLRERACRDPELTDREDSVTLH